jgi:plastocyanin
VRIALLALTVAIVGCGHSSQPTVKAEDFDFSKATLSVTAGDSVKWTNAGATEHTVKGPGFFSKAIDPGGTFEHRFARAGTYRYICTLHPQAMRATIVVR